MSQPWRMRRVLACVIVISLGACQQGQKADSPVSAQYADRSQGAPSRNQPTAHAAAKQAKPPVAGRSFPVLMHGLAPHDQRLVHEWYQRIDAPPMSEATPAQLAWMRARHYPMPADIVRAASMSTSALQTASSTGDATAQFLYAARLLHEYSRRYRTMDASSDPIRYGDPKRFHLLVEINRMTQQLLASGSPYAGYLYAARERLMYPDNNEARASAQLAGLIWADKFGDTRAKHLLNAPAVQAVSAASASVAIKVMLNEALRNNPKLFSIPVTTIPSSGH